MNNLSLRQRQQIRNHRDLVDATLRLIAKNGLELVNIESITLEAGMSRGTLYAYFPDGLHALIREAYLSIGADMMAKAEKQAKNENKWSDKITAYVDAMIMIAEDGEIGKFFNITGPWYFHNCADKGKYSQQTRENIIFFLKEAQHKGIINGDFDCESMACFLIGIIREIGIEISNQPEKTKKLRSAFRKILSSLKTK